MLVRELVALYVRHCEVESVHCETAKKDRAYTFGLFVAKYAELRVCDLKPFHLTDLIEEHPEWRSVATRRAKSNAIRACFQWAAEQERIERNPFRLVRYAEAERRPDLPDEDLSRVYLLANKPFERVCRFLRLTGCRVGELCKARWQDMDLAGGQWTIPLHKSRKHTGKPKLVALVPEAVELLCQVAGAVAFGPVAGSVTAVVATPAQPTAFVFLNTRGKPWNANALGMQLRRLKARHGVHTMATLHGIRHRFGTAGVVNGAPLKLISAQLGHSSVAVTEAYYVDLSGQMDAIRAAAAKALPKE